MLVELRDYLSEVLEMPVDVVTDGGLKPRIQERVWAEAIEI
jgi:predicted nucleotidyltransferase